MPLLQSSSRTSTNVRRVREIGYCDRCNCRRYLDELPWQFDWRGNALQNLRIRVCYDTCLDVPQEQRRPIVISPDPVPIRDARPGWAATQMQGNGIGPYTPAVYEFLTDDTGEAITDDTGSPIDID